MTDADLNPARKEGESFEDYWKRRAKENISVKRYLKGRFIKWEPSKKKKEKKND